MGDESTIFSAEEEGGRPDAVSSSYSTLPHSSIIHSTIVVLVHFTLLRGGRGRKEAACGISNENPADDAGGE